jgi:hypothetical protein
LYFGFSRNTSGLRTRAAGGLPTLFLAMALTRLFLSKRGRFVAIA